jgi:hypothetical protein
LFKIFLVLSVTQQLCGVHSGFQFATITALPNFTLDASSSVIYNLYAITPLNICHFELGP